MKISVIIPTLDRGEELKRLFVSFGLQTKKPFEIIVVDQGRENLSRLIAKYQELKIVHKKVDFQSLTKARNFGVKIAQGDIISFLDDDIILDKNYIKSIESFFEERPQALGVQGVITDFEKGHRKKVGGGKLVYFLYNWFAKFFLLNNSSKKNKLLWSGRNQYASRVEDVSSCEWLSGIGNYKKEVFTEFSFDEKLKKYALGEDKLFSYPIFEKYGKVLFVDSKILCEHRHAEDGRPKEKEWVEMKITYTYYLWNKLFRKKGFLAFLAFYWANFGDLLLVLFSAFLRQNSFKFWWWHLQKYFSSDKKI